VASRTVVQKVDDLDGTDITDGQGETITFIVDGAQYEIDLTNEHARQLRDAFSVYVANGRRISGGRGRSSGSATVPAQRVGSGSARDYDPKAIRKWAESNRVALPARGRMPQAVVQQYKAAGN
jgi:hypothetical protein